MIQTLILAGFLSATPAPDVPTPIEIRAPVLHDDAVKAQMFGVVTVELSIGANGVPVKSAVISQPNPLLGRVALDAAREWRFAPVADTAIRKYVATFEFSVDVAAPTQGSCPVGPPVITVLLPQQLIRVRSSFRPPPPTVAY